MSQKERMPDLLTLFQEDRGALERTFYTPFCERRFERMQRFLEHWRAEIDRLPFEDFSASDQIDWLLFRSFIDTEERRLRHQEEQFAATEFLLPFAKSLMELEERRRAFEDVDPSATASILEAARHNIESCTAGLRDGSQTAPPTVAGLASRFTVQLQEMLKRWHGFYHTYDPRFDWWVENPYRALDVALTEYARFLRETVAGAVGDTVIGEPVGREALLAELAFSQVPYSPEELIAAGDDEWEWCRSELKRAAAEMGLGDDWRTAMELVKNDHSEPGRQPALVRDLSYEAIEYVESNDLVTVPPVARECWRMEMMSAERQKVNPFFLGGETIIVSFPTSDMTESQKRMSLRGNNKHFARATVHHELIPGHHLQLYSIERNRPYRRLFWTPFWIEGWTLHWEMLLWERQFGRTPEERIGMLFWRMHRAARVVFSLKFHLGEMTAAECIEMLVSEACHERANAVAEVRRSFEGDYGSLYQCAYLIGGWQMHALYREMVESGNMSPREFHDRVLQENCMPIPLLRAALQKASLTRDFTPNWRFYPLPPTNGTSEA